MSSPATLSIAGYSVLLPHGGHHARGGSYEAAWAAYPAWGDKACLVLGVAIPARDDPQRAKGVRDRFVQEVFSKTTVTGHEEPKERY